MQKQTFEQIKEMKNVLKELRYMISAGWASNNSSFTHELHEIKMQLSRNFTLQE